MCQIVENLQVIISVSQLGNYHDIMFSVYKEIRVETNNYLIHLYSLNKYLNTQRVFGCTMNDFSALFLTYFVITTNFEVISVIK